MRIGLLADTHNDRYRLKIALEYFRTAQITTLLHAGDVTTIATLKLLSDFQVWIAQGNLDRDPELFSLAQQLFGEQRLLPLHKLTLNKVNIALIHGDNWPQLERLLRSGNYDYLVSGHTHTPQDEKIGSTRMINPGAVGNTRWTPPSCAILDLSNGDLEWLKL